ncbi:MAG: AcrR family transcriptional regulator [Oleiphilaceae bacterium]|jgi:AcrR family transcriptional regulator
MSSSNIAKNNSNLVSPRKMPRQARARATVTRILDGTRKVLREQGADGVTTRSIAEASGIRTGSIYQYFPNKEAILFALYGNRMEETVLALNGLMTPKNLQLSLADFWGVFDNVVQTELKWGQPEDVELDKAMGENPALIDANAKVLHELYQSVVKLLTHYGSTWSEHRLLELADYIYRLNHFGYTMRIRQTKDRQQSTRKFTFKAIIHLMEMAINEVD